MKHNLAVTLSLVMIFLSTQLVGLVTVSRYIDIRATAETGVTKVYEEKYIIPPPEVNESSSFVFIMIMLLLGTGLALLIIKLNKVLLWKLWFLLSVMLCLTIGLFPYIELLVQGLGLWQAIGSKAVLITLIVSLAFTLAKLFLPNPFVYNITEVFIYSGIAAILVPVLNLFSVVMLLLLISLYDFWAVNKSRHMVRLADFQRSTRLFAGLVLPYTAAPPKQKPKKAKSEAGVRQAILGGGDIAFPLLFTGVVLKLSASFFNAFIISLFASAALFGLFLVARKDQYYPAMPFISIGCMLGLIVVSLI